MCGNLHRNSSAPSDGTTTYRYDALGRVTLVTHSGDSNTVQTFYGADAALNGRASQLCSTSSYGYGYPALSIDEAGKKRQTWAAAFGNVIEVDEPDSSGSLTGSGANGTCSLYDPLGKLKEIDQGSQSRKYSHDMISRLTSAQVPESGTTSFYYTTSGGGLCSGDPGAVCRRTDARGITTTYAYNDALDRLTSKSYSGGTPPAYFYYDLNSAKIQGWTINNLTNTKGRLRATCTDAGSSPCSQATTATIYSYDAAGRVANLWQCTPYNCATGSWETQYTYDTAGNVSTWTHPGGFTITNNYNAAEQVTSITSSLQDSTHPGTLATLTYGPSGALATLVNGAVSGGIQRQETYDYNNRLEPVRIQLGQYLGNLSAYSCLVYNYYSGSNASSCIIPSQGSGNNGNTMGYLYQDTTNSSYGHSAAYSYDALNRLTSAAATGSSTYNLTFVYNQDGSGRYGNMSCQTNGSTHGPCPNWTFNGATNQIATSGYSYDAAGNLTGDGTHSYQWDGEGRLKSVDSGSTESYTYNGLGQRAEWKEAGIPYEFIYAPAGPITGMYTGGSWNYELLSLGGRYLAQYNSGGTLPKKFHSHLGYLYSSFFLSVSASAVGPQTRV